MNLPQTYLRLTVVPVLVFAMRLAISGAEQPTTYFVDLTAPTGVTNDGSAKQVPESERLRMDATVTSHQALSPYPELTVTLGSFDANSYFDDTPFVVEMTIGNSGDGPLVFPIAVDNAQVSRNDAGAVAAHLRLEFDDAALGGRNFAFLADLYGAAARNGTVVVLKPKESLKIRAESHWWTRARRSPESRRAGTESVVRVTAAVELRPVGRLYAPVRSGNEIPIILRAR